MKKRSNPHIIGLFIIGALTISLASLIFFGSVKFSQKQDSFVLFFEESINGLDIGSRVKFRGVPIGQVKAILIRTAGQREDSFHIPVLVDIDRDALDKLFLSYDKSKLDTFDGNQLESHIEAGLRGRLQLESLITGLYYIELDYFDNLPEFDQPLQDSPEYLEIPTIPSPLEAITQTAAGSINKLNKIDYEHIGRNLEGIINKLNALNLEPLEKNLSSTLQAIEQRIKSKEVDQLLAHFNETLAEFRTLAKEGNRMLTPQSPLRYQVDRAIVNLAEAAQAVKELAEFLERNPRALISGRPE